MTSEAKTGKSNLNGMVRTGQEKYSLTIYGRSWDEILKNVQKLARDNSLDLKSDVYQLLKKLSFSDLHALYRNTTAESLKREIEKVSGFSSE